MKRLALVVCLMLAATILAAPQAQARDRVVCKNKTFHTYVGLESPVLHLRWGDLITTMRACYNRRTDAIIKKRTNVSMDIRPNGVSESFGTNWNIYGPWKGDQTDYRDERYFMGTFRNCQGIGSARICGPTGHFTVVLGYQSPTGACGCEGFSQYRRAGEPNKSPDDFDKKIRFYNTP